MFIASRLKWDMLFDETDYRYFYEHDDMIKFINKNEDYQEREDMEYPHLLYDVLNDLFKIAQSVSGLDKMEAYGEYIHRYVYYPNHDNTKYHLGFITNIYFSKLLFTEEDRENGKFVTDILEVGDIVSGGNAAFHFVNFSELSFDKYIVPDHSHLIRKKKKKSNVEVETEKSYIYFIQNTYDNSIKIGYTKNIKNRLSQLQTSTPHKLQLLHYIEGDINKEKKLHEKFKEYRLSGEWFKENELLKSYINKLATV